MNHLERGNKQIRVSRCLAWLFSLMLMVSGLPAELVPGASSMLPSQENVYAAESWGAWSDWQETPVEETATRQVETKDQYCYSAPTYTYTWGAWSSWQTSAVTASTTRQVETRTITEYYLEHYCTGDITGTNNDFQTYPTNDLNATFKTYCSNHNKGWSDLSGWTYRNVENGYYGYWKPYTKSDGTTGYYEKCTNTCYTYYATKSRRVTQYRYKDATGLAGVSYNNYTAWSDEWPDVPNDYMVSVRTLYRYRNALAQKTQKLTVSCSQNTLLKGETAKITASSNQGTKIIYSSSNTNVASVSSTGKITALKAGTATITVKAAGNDTYKSASSKIEIRVLSKPISVSGSVIKVSSCTYTGTARKPKPTVTKDGIRLVRGTDYKVSYKNNIKAGTATLTITGIGHYTGTARKSFTINKAAQKLTIKKSTVSKYNNASAFTNSLSTRPKENAKVTYSSSNTSVATVSKTTGKVTIKGTGTVKIKARTSATANYKATSKTYTLKVKNHIITPMGYNFSNSYASFDYTPANAGISKSTFNLMFVPSIATEYYNTYGSWSGNCYGMCTSAALMCVRGNGINISSFKNGARYVRELALTNKNGSGITIRQFIEGMQVVQKLHLYMLSGSAYTENTSVAKLVNEVKKTKTTGNPVIVNLYGAMYSGGYYAGSAGHSLAAYSYKSISSTEGRIYVYDPNFPGETRYITVKKNSNGTPVSWSYDMNDLYSNGMAPSPWGIGKKDSFMFYNRYSEYRAEWVNRPHSVRYRLAATTALAINSDDFEIYNEAGELVAKMENGEMTENASDVLRQAPGVTADYNGENWEREEYILLILPLGEYHVVDTDGEEDELTVAMLDMYQSAEVTTTANELTLEVNDQDQINEVIIEDPEAAEYTVVLSSELENDEITRQVFEDSDVSETVSLVME